MLVFSVHADTNFKAHSLRNLGGGVFQGHMDNFIGVHAMMLAYFSGRLTGDHIRIELTYGEETDFEGARSVAKTLHPKDTVIVVDVTATPTDKPVVFEKCRSKSLREFLGQALHPITYDLYHDCPDPVADLDETDIYQPICPETCFLGIPCFGGDYNRGQVFSSEFYLSGAVNAISRISNHYFVSRVFAPEEVERQAALLHGE